MNDSSGGRCLCSDKIRVVEIVGPAGAGKTTLYQALGCHTDSFQSENFPDVRKIADAPFFVLNGLKLVPSLIQLYRPRSRQLTRREFAWMAILRGWPSLLRAESKETDKLIILDQGPIYLMAEMRLFGPEYLKHSSAQGLWQSLYEYWQATLDMVISLDAANDVLLNRIRIRDQEHSVKNEPAAVVFEFLNRYRSEYETLLTTLAAKRTDLKVLQIDTGCRRSGDIVDQLLSEFC